MKVKARLLSSRLDGDIDNNITIFFCSRRRYLKNKSIY